MAEWNPWAGMEALRREIDRAFEQFNTVGEPFARTAFLPGRAARRYPLINLHEDRETMYVEALAPGVDPTSFEVSVVGNALTITGEKRRHANGVKPEAFHRSERATGKFVRTIELPVEVNANQVKADYRDGILMVSLPKAEQAKPKQISVQVA